MSQSHITLMSESDALPHPVGSALFKQSILRWAVGLALLDGMATLLALGIFLGKAPQFLWIVVGILLALTPLVVRGLVRAVSPQNWLLRVDDDALLIHFRSFYRASGPGAMTVCHIPMAKVESVRSVTERFARKKSDSSEKWSEHSLEINLEEGCTSEIFLAINDDRTSNMVDPSTGERRKMVLHHYPVRMPEIETLHLKFKGKRDAVTPGLQKALDKLSHTFEMAEPLVLDYTKPEELSQEHFDQAILSLAESGQIFTATHYLMKRTDCSLTEAHTTIEQLMGQETLDAAQHSKAAA